jgi:hypothetical protein
MTTLRWSNQKRKQKVNYRELDKQADRFIQKFGYSPKKVDKVVLEIKTSNAMARLKGFLGSFGYRTHALKSEGDYIRAAAGLFELPEAPTCHEMVEAIAGLSKQERARRGRRYRMTVQSTHVVQRDPPANLDQMPEDWSRLFHQVVMAVINAGHASDLYDHPEVLEYFGSQAPNGEVVWGDSWDGISESENRRL